MILQGNSLLALAAAAGWGGADFSGGMGVKTAGGSTRAALRFIFLAHSISFVVLVGILLVRRQAVPVGVLLGWSLLAGVAGSLALTAFYIALSRGKMGVSAAVSGLLGAAIPALVSMGMEGVPGAKRLIGFGLALVAIWVIAAGPSPENAGGRATMGLAVLAGVGFGVYFVALRAANPLGLMLPIALARAASLVTCTVILLIFRILGRNEGTSVKRMTGAIVMWAVGVAVLDTGGNMLFLGATRLGRLDVAAVLASLYPVGTILLAAWKLHERPTRRQVMGMVTAVAAVVMITI